MSCITIHFGSFQSTIPVLRMQLYNHIKNCSNFLTDVSTPTYPWLCELLLLLISLGTFCDIIIINIYFTSLFVQLSMPISYMKTHINPVFCLHHVFLSHYFFHLQVLYKHKIILFGGFYDTLREVRLLTLLTFSAIYIKSLTV